ncbi:YiiD C-terminal domain-containing protein [Pseudomonas schmalbachii]|uniref:YiiD C-terminal domain-containing protein n=1 Tax=Pseudomonas schmalbachii TaxID=2816993 RepID=A0ABS3TRX3_9PSED|nr:YiiD C-terminal domain-containing protein [Pseudomonas schmalbachii]MBO3276414.1 YiiD C-terminal domain-containing protein [Pseudomonas schmalbachii]
MTIPTSDDIARAEALTRYLHEHIPLTVAMDIRAQPSPPGHLRLSAPHAPNRNPHNTVFGGSLATLAIAAGWTLLFDALRREELHAALVIQHYECDYRAPAAAEFVAEAVLPAEWPAFVEQLRTRKRARLKLPVSLTCEGREVLTASAMYAARMEG